MLAHPPTPAHQLTATPSSYLTYDFPLPAKKYVGILAAQRDPLLTTLDAEVLRCDRVVRAPIAAAGKGKKAKAPLEEVPDEWEIELDDSVLFPEGGGQNSDQGTLQLLSPEGTVEGAPANVREILRRNLNAVHFVSAAFPVGSRVRVQLDVERRRDLMCQHTGQHLLSGVIDDELKADTLSWSLTPSPQPCYIELPRAPTEAEINRIQRRCNDLIMRGTSVSVAMHLAGSGIETPGSKIPENYKGEDGQQGVVRVVEIHGLGDANPCCGTHYPSLSYLQSIFILPQTQSVRGTNTRLFFLVGPRVLSHLSTMHTIAREASLELGCAPSDLPTRVSNLLLSSRDGTKREKRLREEVASSVAEGMWKSAMEKAGQGEVLSAVSLREEDATNSLEFLVQVAGELKSKLEADVAVGGGPEKKHLFVLACGVNPPGGASPTTNGGSLLIFGSDDIVAKAGKEVAVKLPGRVKGGGKGRWQGKLVDARWEKGDRELLRQVLADAVKP
ncbi:misacylated tRNA(Ala) deacylase, partial [Phenoliferia sp. Uapishka_3]